MPARQTAVHVRQLLPKSSAEKLIIRAVERENPLGTGAYGAVYRGECRTFGAVALKVLHLSSDMINPSSFACAERTLLREFAVGRKVQHPNLARIFAFGSVRWGGERKFCVVSEFVEGIELRAGIVRFTTTEQRLQILLHIARGLEAIHDAGIVHRDLSSRNVIVTPGGIARILDFGIAFFIQATLSSLSLPVDLLERDSEPAAFKLRGNPMYMAPEAWEPHRCDQVGAPRFDPTTGLYIPIFESDVFAFGILAYELLSDGRHPFAVADMSLQEIRDANCRSGPPVWPLQAKVPSDVRDMFTRCLDKSIRARPSLTRIIEVLASAVRPHVTQAVAKPAEPARPEPPKNSLAPAPDSYGADDSDQCTYNEDGVCDNQMHWGSNE